MLPDETPVRRTNSGYFPLLGGAESLPAAAEAERSSSGVAGCAPQSSCPADPAQRSRGDCADPARVPPAPSPVSPSRGSEASGSPAPDSGAAELQTYSSRGGGDPDNIPTTHGAAQLPARRCCGGAYPGRNPHQGCAAMLPDETLVRRTNSGYFPLLGSAESFPAKADAECSSGGAAGCAPQSSCPADPAQRSRGDCADPARVPPAPSPVS